MAIALSLAALGGAAGASPASAAGATGSADFNGDGRADLPIGARDESFLAAQDGAVHILYGRSGRLSAEGTQIFSLQDLGLTPQGGERLGTSFAHGDINHDGFDDLAVSAPEAPAAGVPAAGVVIVLRGSAAGLRVTGVQRIVSDDPTPGDQFGAALAFGDFDGDEFDDLAVGIPGADDTADGLANVGQVNVYDGGTNGLDLLSNQVLTQDTPGILGEQAANEEFGRALTAADFDFDSEDDLAAAAPLEDVGTAVDAGAVNVVYGRPLVGLSATNGAGEVTNQLWTQASADGFGPVAGTARSGDRFGSALASGKLDKVGGDDLAVGTPTDDVVGGSVNILYGKERITDDGLNTRDNQNWSQSDTRAGTSEPGDDFGFALTVGDFDGDDAEDLGVGVPGEVVGTALNAGAFNAIYGKESFGLAKEGAEVFVQKAIDPALASEPFDVLGLTMAAGDYDGNGEDDLAAGAPSDHLAGIPVGTVTVVYGKNPLIGEDGLDITDHDLWHQNVTGIPGAAENADSFGDGLG